MLLHAVTRQCCYMIEPDPQKYAVPVLCHRFTTLELAALKALQQRSRNRQEEQLLAARAQAQGQQGRGGGGGGPPGQAYEGVEQDEERRQEMLEQLRRIAVDLGATGNKRQELRDQVGGVGGDSTEGRGEAWEGGDREQGKRWGGEGCPWAALCRGSDSLWGLLLAWPYPYVLQAQLCCSVRQLRQAPAVRSGCTSTCFCAAAYTPQVFRQGHLPPTRTLAEQAAIEMEEARQREEVGQAPS
jgi:hypothetical protein